MFKAIARLIAAIFAPGARTLGELPPTALRQALFPL